MSLFSERSPIPTRVVQALTDKGELGQEVLRESRAGFVREIDTDVVMTVDTAKLLRDWLTARIAEFDEFQRATLKLDRPGSKK